MGNHKKAESAFILLRDEIEKHLSAPEADFVLACYTIALSLLGRTSSEEAFFDHSLNTALDLARLRLGADFIGSILLYYPLITKRTTISQISSSFGNGTASIVRTLLKIEDLLEPHLPWRKAPAQKAKRKRERSIDNTTNAFLAIARIPEIAVVKIVDRLHLLKRANRLLPDKASRQILAQQALDTHSVVAERLGIWSIKWQLDDAAFVILHPDVYQAIVDDLGGGRQERDERIDRAIGILSKALMNEGINAEIGGRPKHIYGLYLKIAESGKSVHEVNDNLGIRVIVNEEEECYRTLDIVYGIWPPVEGIYGDRIVCRDWIARPKPNGYQSIHTTVDYTEDQNWLLEVQIRTREMHERAEYGIAAHWIYTKAGSIVASQRRYQRFVDDMAFFRRSFERRQKKKPRGAGY
jgi:(p)ppGpp synthase/HD superfamily hydrolase